MANDNTTDSSLDLPEDGPWNWSASKLSQQAGNTLGKLVDDTQAAVPAIDQPWALTADQLANQTKNTFPEPPPPALIQPAYAPQSISDIYGRVIQTETRGRHTDASGNLITSSKGAQGISQLMPATAEAPGFGVTPLQNNSKEEYLRVGKDYLTALVKFFHGDEQKAVAAYNTGPGNVQKAITKSTKLAGSDWTDFLPKETQNYLTKVLGNGLALVTGSSNANASADFNPYLATNKTETGATVAYNGKPDGGKFVSQSNALGAQLVGIIKKDFPDHIDAIDTKITGNQPSEGATASYGGLNGDQINLGKIIGSNTQWFDKNGKPSKNNQPLPTSTVNEALATTLHEIQHARMNKIGTFNDGLGDNWKGMLDDAAKGDFPSVDPQGVRNGDALNEFLATATTIKEMQRKGYPLTGRYQAPAAALTTMESKYPWLKQYVINYIYPEAANNASNRQAVEQSRNKK